MKVLFAVSNEEISENIVKKYQKEYKEIISYKNVYYFNAILKELQGQIKPHQVIQAKKQLGDLKHQKKQVENHEDHDYKIGDIVKVLSVNRQGEVVDINKKGITPDVEAELSGDITDWAELTHEEDTQLQTALKELEQN